MSTNYYANGERIVGHGPVCLVEKETLHIGKSSGGWCFSLHVIPEEGINDLEDWQKLLSSGDWKIEDEYGRVVSYEELMSVITERSSPGSVKASWPTANFLSSYQDYDHFMELNQAEEGPNNLLRHRLSGLCIKHGAGTWDCLVGEFS